MRRGRGDVGVVGGLGGIAPQQLTHQGKQGIEQVQGNFLRPDGLRMAGILAGFGVCGKRFSGWH